MPLRALYVLPALMVLGAGPLAAVADPAASAATAADSAAVRDSASVPAAEPAPAGDPDARLLLSWRAAHGTPRATSVLEASCGPRATEDTLYLCFVPGRDSPTFNGFTARLLIHPAEGDSIAPFWREARPDGSLLRVRVLLGADSSHGAPSPFKVEGFGSSRADLVPEGIRVRCIFAVSHLLASPVQAGRTYVLARVLVPRPPRGDAACGRTMCVEWQQASLAYRMGDEPTVDRGDRFAGLNAPLDAACATFRARAGAWRREVRPGP